MSAGAASPAGLTGLDIRMACHVATVGAGCWPGAQLGLPPGAPHILLQHRSLSIVRILHSAGFIQIAGSKRTGQKLNGFSDPASGVLWHHWVT